MPDMQTFLIKPFDNLIIRQAPIYREKYFILEQLTKELNLYKERATTRDFPMAKTPEEFLEAIGTSDSFCNRKGNRRTCKKVRRPGWIKVRAASDTTIEELWPMAMDKVGDKEFYKPDFLNPSHDVRRSLYTYNNKINQRS